MRATGLTPESHGMRILLCVGFDGRSDASIGISFAQDGVDGRPRNLLVATLNVAFFVRFGFGGVKGDIVALGAEFGNAILQLINGRRNVGEFDNGTVGLECQFSEMGEIVGDALLFIEEFRKGGQDTPSYTDIAWDNVDIREVAKL